MSRTLGTLIRERRHDLGLSQRQLAERIGAHVDQSDISRLEHDRITRPRHERIERLAAALDLPASPQLVLAGWTDDQDRAPVPPLAPPSDSMNLGTNRRAGGQTGVGIVKEGESCAVFHA